MDIQQWSVNEIMQLPDCAFGSQYPIMTSRYLNASTWEFWIVEYSLPDRFVLWELVTVWTGAHSSLSVVRFGLLDHAPADEAGFQRAEPLFISKPETAADGCIFPLNVYMENRVRCRLPIHAQGRRWVLAARNAASSVMRLTCVMTISSIPREVPDWLVRSGHLR